MALKSSRHKTPKGTTQHSSSTWRQREATFDPDLEGWQDCNTSFPSVHTFEANGPAQTKTQLAWGTKTAWRSQEITNSILTGIDFSGVLWTKPFNLRTIWVRNRQGIERWDTWKQVIYLKIGQWLGLAELGICKVPPTATSLGQSHDLISHVGMGDTHFQNALSSLRTPAQIASFTQDSTHQKNSMGVERTVQSMCFRSWAALPSNCEISSQCIKSYLLLLLELIFIYEFILHLLYTINSLQFSKHIQGASYNSMCTFLYGLLSLWQFCKTIITLTVPLGKSK